MLWSRIKCAIIHLLFYVFVEYMHGMLNKETHMQCYIIEK